MNLELKINSVPMVLGQTIEPKALERADFHKTGPLRRLFKRFPVSQTLYLADNCKLECFEEGFCIYPCTHGYLNRDRQWKTKASVFLQNGMVCKLEFQVVDGKYAASNFLERFQEACSAVLGDPVESTRFLTRWKNDAAAVTSILHPDKVNADFLMELQEA
jgi:hypothetical protein